MNKYKKSNDFVKEYMERLKKEEQIKKNMLSNDNYIEWLVSFLKETEGQRFCDDDWLCFPEKLSAENKQNVDNLHLFVELCMNEAYKNLITPNHSSAFSDGEVYVKYLDNYILLGSVSGQGTFFFAQLITDFNDKEYVDWSLVKNKELSEEGKKRRKILENLEKNIKEALNQEIDADYIHETIENIKKRRT